MKIFLRVTFRLKKIICRWCGNTFYICQSCWHGQVYCSDTCRDPAQKKIHNKAQKLYRQTGKGKTAHAEAEKRRRLGQSKKNMDDASTTPPCDHDNNSHNVSSMTPCCHFCGAKGVVVEHFPHREYGGRYTTDSFINYY